LGQVSVPYGTCGEPSNVRPADMLARSGSVVSAAIIFVPTHLTFPNSRHTYRTSYAIAKELSLQPISMIGPKTQRSLLRKRSAESKNSFTE